MLSKDTFSLVLGIIVGAPLYVILNFIPLVGPFLSGFTAGKISQGGLKNGSLAGFFSGVIGSLLIFSLFSGWVYSWGFLSKFLVGGFLLLWNLVGIILTTIGGIVGAIFHPKKESQEERKILVVCKNCKSTNPKGKKYCDSCGEKL